MYLNGLGVERNFDAALTLYRLAAAQGEANSQASLGYMYRNGFGVEKNYDEALKWLRMSAAQGDAFGQSNLGYMHELGFGVKQDYGEAARWYLLAAAQGYDYAKKRLQIAVIKAAAEQQVRQKQEPIVEAKKESEPRTQERAPLSREKLLSQFRETCLELGFKTGAPAFAECVLVLDRRSRGAEAVKPAAESVTAEPLAPLKEDPVAKEKQERERDAMERAALSREQFVTLHTDLLGLLKKNDFSAADQRYKASCIEKKAATAACRFLLGHILAEKSRIELDSSQSVAEARLHLEAAFSGDDAEISVLAAASLRPLLKRLAAIQVKEARLRKDAEIAAERERLQEQKRDQDLERAEKLAQMRAEAERQRQVKAETARQETEARRGDGTVDDLHCKRLGLKPTTPKYANCRQDLAGKAERERIAQEEVKQATEAANRGDGTPDHATCMRNGFPPNSPAYSECRLQSALARQQMNQQRAEYETQHRLDEK